MRVRVGLGGKKGEWLEGRKRGEGLEGAYIGGGAVRRVKRVRLGNTGV